MNEDLIYQSYKKNIAEAIKQFVDESANGQVAYTTGYNKKRGTGRGFSGCRKGRNGSGRENVPNLQYGSPLVPVYFQNINQKNFSIRETAELRDYPIQDDKYTFDFVSPIYPEHINPLEVKDKLFPPRGRTRLNRKPFDSQLRHNFIGRPNPPRKASIRTPKFSFTLDHFVYENGAPVGLTSQEEVYSIELWAEPFILTPGTIKTIKIDPFNTLTGGWFNPSAISPYSPPPYDILFIYPGQTTPSFIENFRNPVTVWVGRNSSNVIWNYYESNCVHIALNPILTMKGKDKKEDEEEDEEEDEKEDEKILAEICPHKNLQPLFVTIEQLAQEYLGWEWRPHLPRHRGVFIRNDVFIKSRREKNIIAETKRPDSYIDFDLRNPQMRSFSKKERKNFNYPLFKLDFYKSPRDSKPVFSHQCTGNYFILAEPSVDVYRSPLPQSIQGSNDQKKIVPIPSISGFDSQDSLAWEFIQIPFFTDLKICFSPRTDRIIQFFARKTTDGGYGLQPVFGTFPLVYEEKGEDSKESEDDYVYASFFQYKDEEVLLPWIFREEKGQNSVHRKLLPLPVFLEEAGENCEILKEIDDKSKTFYALNALARTDRVFRSFKYGVFVTLAANEFFGSFDRQANVATTRSSPTSSIKANIQSDSMIDDLLEIIERATTFGQAVVPLIIDSCISAHLATEAALAEALNQPGRKRLSARQRVILTNTFSKLDYLNAFGGTIRFRKYGNPGLKLNWLKQHLLTFQGEDGIRFLKIKRSFLADYAEKKLAENWNVNLFPFCCQRKRLSFSYLYFNDYQRQICSLNMIPEGQPIGLISRGDFIWFREKQNKINELKDKIKELSSQQVSVLGDTAKMREEIREIEKEMSIRFENLPSHQKLQLCLETPSGQKIVPITRPYWVRVRELSPLEAEDR